MTTLIVAGLVALVIGIGSGFIIGYRLGFIAGLDRADAELERIATDKVLVAYNKQTAKILAEMSHHDERSQPLQPGE